MESDKKEKVTALVKQVEGMTLEGMAQHFIKSGYFKDASDPSKAVVKIMAGREVGLPPVASMMGLYVIEGKVTYSATMVGALIKRAGYKYIVQWTEDNGGTCILNFRDKEGLNLGTSSFSMSDAKAAGLAGKNTWAKYPRAMMFARALSQGGRWFCPEAFAGGCYTPEELDPKIAVTEDGEVVDGEVVETRSTIDPLVAKRDKMIAAFAGKSVTLDALEAFCGCPVTELTADNVEKLKVIFAELRAGKRDTTLTEVREGVEDDTDIQDAEFTECPPTAAGGEAQEPVGQPPAAAASNQGPAPEASAKAPAAPPDSPDGRATAEQVNAIFDLVAAAGMSKEWQEKQLSVKGISQWSEMKEDQAALTINWLKARIEKKRG